MAPRRRRTPGRALYEEVFECQLANSCSELEASATAFAVWMEADSRTCPAALATCPPERPSAADSDEHGTNSQAPVDTQNLGGFNAMQDDGPAHAAPDIAESGAQADRQAMVMAAHYARSFRQLRHAIVLSKYTSHHVAIRSGTGATDVRDIAAGVHWPADEYQDDTAAERHIPPVR